MVLFAQLLFWLSFLCLLHSYVLYPALMAWISKGKTKNHLQYNLPNETQQLPSVSVLMSVFNEEKVLSEKLESLAALHYPEAKITYYIGSDCSSDNSHALIEQFILKRPNFHFFPFKNRRGKPPVINDLAERALQNTDDAGHLLLMTDASVMMRPNALLHLAKHFKNPKIGVVDALILSTGKQQSGISQSEGNYMNREVALKDAESRAWGMMIGPFGGCYALRAELFEPVPANFLVDDFYITFRVLEKGYLAINELEALCTEGATHEMSDEYRRKKRIAAGSFQNLNTFRKWVLPPFTKLGFAFFSHKVLRWFGGFLLLFMFVSALFLSIKGILAFQVASMLFFFLFLFVPIVHFALKSLNMSFAPFKNITYFLAMNLALTAGFFKYILGIKSNIWQPTKRY